MSIGQNTLEYQHLVGLFGFEEMRTSLLGILPNSYNYLKGVLKSLRKQELLAKACEHHPAITEGILTREFLLEGNY